MTTRRVTSPDGTTLAVHEPPATATGPVVVAVHGYPDNHHVWDGVVAELSGSLRVVTYDVRGAGDSDVPRARSAYRIERLVDDLVSVVDAVSPDAPVHLLAHDWGSIQTWPALTDPRLRGRVASYTSVSGPSLEHVGAWLRRAHRHPAAAASQLADSWYTMLFQLPAVPEALVRLGVTERMIRLAGARHRSAVARESSAHRNVDDGVHGLELYRANMPGRTIRRTPSPIDVPVQVLLPREDAYLDPRTCAQAPEPWVAHLYTRDLAGGHWVVSERPEVVARCVREFVDHLDGGPRPRRLVRVRDRGRGEFGDQLVLVTGGARGIGRATALEFARQGADVVVLDIDDVAAEQVVGELTALGVQAGSYHLDVADPQAWDEVVAQVLTDHGVPDVVVNNAGIGMSGPFLATSAEDWRRILDVNLWGVLHGCRLLGRALVERGEGGRIVTVASAAAFMPSRTYPAYATTKAAVLMLTECLRAELGREGIGVTAVCPGFVDSDISRTTVHVGVDEREQQARREHAAAAYRRRNFTPERLARHIVRAAARDTPVAVVGTESRVFRALTRFVPPLARAVATVDLAAL